jgi:hypothetical protein
MPHAAPPPAPPAGAVLRFLDEAITFSFKLFQILLYLLGFAQHRQAMR